jgi:hypothetical protein
MQTIFKKNPCKMATLTNRACKFPVALLVLQTELKGGVEASSSRYTLVPMLDDNDEVF